MTHDLHHRRPLRHPLPPAVDTVAASAPAGARRPSGGARTGTDSDSDTDSGSDTRTGGTGADPDADTARGERPPAAPPGGTRRQPPVDGASPRRPPGDGRKGSEAGRPAPRQQAKPRDPFFDNAKYLAIVLVALGHSWEPLRHDSHTAKALYIFVYTFHMPAFMVISGYFSRSFEGRPHQLKRLVTGVAVPYLLFEVAYSLFKRWADDDPSQPISLLDPWYLTWFLVALFVWRLTTPLWKAVRWPVPLALAIAVLASVSPDIGDDLDLQRVLQFLPFFVIGLFLRPDHFELLHRRSARLLSIPVVLGSLGVAWWATDRMNSAWFYHRDSAQELGAPWWVGVVMTFALFGCSLVLTACFLAWVPRRRMWFTALGAGTLYGYLLHGFLAKGSRFWDWYDTGWVQTPWGAVLVTAIAGTVITLLCTPPVQRAFRFAMEPRMPWAFRQDPAAAARDRQRAGQSAGGR